MDATVGYFYSTIHLVLSESCRNPVVVLLVANRMGVAVSRIMSKACERLVSHK